MKNVTVKYNTQVVYTMKEMNEVGEGLQDIIPKQKRGWTWAFSSRY